ncbi:MAG: nicotinate-nucleotide diphosphorylase (carboxylating), partial [Gammaproteobacteria bacterium]|nr:nicotinate-nucleotide diphosphorylase (carboxylating) [Gammaproteobacteria bacterium]
MIMDISEALRARIESGVADALAEDIGTGDVSAGLMPAAAEARGVVTTRQAGVFCGRPWVEEVAR